MTIIHKKSVYLIRFSRSLWMKTHSTVKFLVQSMRIYSSLTYIKKSYVLLSAARYAEGVSLLISLTDVYAIWNHTGCFATCGSCGLIDLVHNSRVRIDPGSRTSKVWHFHAMCATEIWKIIRFFNILRISSIDANAVVVDGNAIHYPVSQTRKAYYYRFVDALSDIEQMKNRNGIQ